MTTSAFACDAIDAGYSFSWLTTMGPTALWKTRSVQDRFSLGELVRRIDTVRDTDNDVMGLTDRFRNMNYDGGDPGELLDFVWVRSTFYPEIGAYYEQHAREWADSRRQAMTNPLPDGV